MLDLRRLVGFDWDEGNSRKNAAKHAVSQLECEQTFFNEPLLLLPDVKHSGAEDKWHALGRSDQGRLLHITFTVRGEATLIRIISARDMSRRERGYYAEGH